VPRIEAIIHFCRELIPQNALTCYLVLWWTQSGPRRPQIPQDLQDICRHDNPHHVHSMHLPTAWLCEQFPLLPTYHPSSTKWLKMTLYQDIFK
jgi:hypothetical protein